MLEHYIRYQPKLIEVMTALSFCMMLILVSSSAGLAQSQNWNLKPREKAQNANSQAINLLEKGPDDPKNKGALDQAISILFNGVQADPTDPLPLATLGLALDIKGRYDSALDALSKSYTLDPRRAETSLSIGLTHYLGYDYEKAIESLIKAGRMDPKNYEIHAPVGFAYMRKGDIINAAEQFNKLITYRPNSQIAYQGMAIVSYLIGDLANATEAAEHAQSIQNYPPVSILLAELAFMRGDESGLKQQLKWLSRTDNKPFRQRSMTAIGYLKQHDFHWDPFLGEEFNNPTFVSLRSLAPPKALAKQKSASRQARIAQVVERARQALAANSADFYLVHQMGLIDLAIGEYENAAQQFNKVLTLCPHCHIDYLYLARALSLTGKTKEAADCVRQFKKIQPDQPLAPIFAAIEKASPAAPAPPPLVPVLPNNGAQPGKSSEPSTGF